MTDAETPGGVWAVRTDLALYLLDLDRRRAVRLAALDREGRVVDGAAVPGLDGSVLRLLEHGPMTLGEELLMVLERGDVREFHTTARVRGLTPITPELTRESPLAQRTSGVWAIRTLTSSHLWDLDSYTYTRIPGPLAAPMAHDGTPLQIHEVLRWPRVGHVSYLTCHDPDDVSLEQWRQSATIVAIQQVG